jgi:thiol-disulfide isomerase/thioredoxin
MKKFFPLVVFIIGFTGFLAGQVFVDFLDISAGISSDKKKINAHYESKFQNSKFNVFGSTGKVINPSKIQAPIVVLNFWASWCRPCLEEFPSITKLKEKFPNNEVYVIGINTDEEDQSKNIQKIIKEYGLNFPIVADHDGKILNDFLVSAIPVSIIFHKGKVIEVSNGAKEFDSKENIALFKKLVQ